MAIDEAKQAGPPDDSADAAGSVALLPEPFQVNAQAVDLAAAAARAALRRTSAALGRYSRPAHPPLLDPFLAAAEPLKLP